MNLPIILLIEDDLNDEELGRIALEENSISCELRVAHDGIEASRMLFDNNLNSCPHVILLDLKLPKMNGLELLKKIRENNRTKFIPVVIFTSSKEESDLRTAYELGANAYIQKPVDFGEFSSALQQIAIFWILWNKTHPEIGKQ